MNTAAIPQWDARQVLPPANLSQPVSPDRSPYQVSLVAVVDRFATSTKRCAILRGLLEFRSRFHQVGVTAGLQWLDGSFMENVEALQLRSPSDIDVVTFLNNAADSAVVPPELADSVAMKFQYLVDSYVIELGFLSPPDIVAHSTYWYSMWSHSRNLTWKGFLSIDLSPTEDVAAMAALMNRFVTLQALASAQMGGG